jgi:asparagine synthase (glutamine-hydrolysing)
VCGIAGIVAIAEAPPPCAAQLRAMCKSLVHRGPDEEGCFLNQQVGLGIRRLAVIDVDGGHQPLSNEDGSIHAVFNGEIYNFRELRQQLASRGHRFRTDGDGEVIVHLLEEYGPDFVTHLNGMFAIAVYDSKRNRLLLVRDRLGIKPLYYAQTSRHLVFGSEIKAVLASELVERTLDLDSLAQFLAWEYVPAPKTLFQGIHKLRPGQMLDVDLSNGRRSCRVYWDIPCHDGEIPACSDSDADWEERADDLVKQCVKRQLISDVPLGAFLSGGVDSSLVVHAMGRATTFSIGFADSSYDESHWARRVARHLNVQHRLELLEPRASELFQRLMHYMDDPLGDFSIFPTYLVSQVARSEVKVALSGDGGDELFGGYEFYLANEKAKSWSRVPALVRQHLAEPCIKRMRPRPAKKGWVNKAKRFVEGLQHDARLGPARWRLFVGEKSRQQLFTQEVQRQLTTPVGEHIFELARQAGQRGELDRAFYVDVKSYLSDNCLAKVDRMSMACSLESRVPLLDHELVEFGFRVPERLKVNRGMTKILLKRVAARYIPRECIYRAKQGFSMPIKAWLRGELQPLMEDLLARDGIAAEGIFQVDTVQRLKNEHISKKFNHSHVLWSLMVFQDWRRRWAV